MALDRTPTADRLESRITGFQNSADYQRSADPPTSADSQEGIQSPLHQFCPSFAFGTVNLVLGKNSVRTNLSDFLIPISTQRCGP